MKFFLTLIGLALTARLFASTPTADIIMQTKLDHENSSMIIERAREVLINNGLGDPYRYKMKKPIIAPLDTLIGEAGQNSQLWLKQLQEFLKIKIFESRYDLQITDFSYDISDFDVALNAKRENDVFVFSAKNRIYKPKLKASSIKVIVSLNRSSTSHQPIFFEIEIVNPVFSIESEASVDILMGWESVLSGRKVNINFKEVDLTKLFLDLNNDPFSYDLDWGDLKVPDLKITIGNKVIKIEQEKLKNYIRENKELMKQAIIDIILTKHQLENGGQFLLKPDLKITLPSGFSFKSDINGDFNLEKETLISSHVIRHDVNGIFCLPLLDQSKFKSCAGHVQPLPPKRTITAAQYEKSMSMFQEYYEKGQASIGLSVSEEYINRLVRTIVEGGLFDTKGKDFDLGPLKAFAQSEVKGQEFSLYVDVLYKPTKGQRFLIGKKELRFPIKLLAKISLENINGIPFFMVDITQHVSTDEMLRKGIPKFGMPSNVESARFTKSIVKAIRKGVAPFTGKRLVEVSLEELKGSYLENTQFMADGQGRAMAIINLTR